MLSQINIKSVAGWVAAILIALIQISLMPYLSISFAVGSLVLIFMIIFIFKGEHLLAFIFAITGGIILDISLGLGFGPFTAPLIISFMVFYLIYERFIQSNIYIFTVFAVLLASLLLDVLFIITILAMRLDISLFLLWPIILKQAAYNTVLAAIIFPIYYYFENRFYPESKIKLPELK